MRPVLHEPFVGHRDLDGRAFLAGALLASAAEQANQALGEVRGLADSGVTSEELAALIKARGMALMELWADLMARTGQDRESWARSAALRAVRAYAGRLGDLMAASAGGGRS